MNRYGPTRNQEGYKDLTAFNAIRNMEGKMMKYKPGDIIETSVGSGKAIALCLIQGEDYVTATRLCEQKPEQNAYYIQSLDKFIDTGRFFWCFNDLCGSKKGSVSSDELDDIKDMIADSFGIKFKVRGGSEVVVHEQIVPNELLIEIAKLKAERDVYKDLFEKMMVR